MMRAAVAILAVALIYLLVCRLSRKAGRDRLNTPSKFGLVVTFIALALWVPTTTTVAFMAPSLTPIATMLVAGLLLAFILFLFLGPVGIAGWFGGVGAGLVKYMTVFGLHTLLSALFGGVFRVVTVGLVSPLVVWSLVFVGFVFLTIGARRRSEQIPSVPCKS